MVLQQLLYHSPLEGHFRAGQRREIEGILHVSLELALMTWSTPQYNVTIGLVVGDC